MDNQERKLRELARLALRFTRASVNLVNAANERAKFDAKSRGLHRASDTYARREALYDQLGIRLADMCRIYIDAPKVAK